MIQKIKYLLNVYIAAVYLGLGVKTSLGKSVVLNRRKRMVKERK